MLNVRIDLDLPGLDASLVTCLVQQLHFVCPAVPVTSPTEAETGGGGGNTTTTAGGKRAARKAKPNAPPPPSITLCGCSDQLERHQNLHSGQPQWQVIQHSMAVANTVEFYAEGAKGQGLPRHRKAVGLILPYEGFATMCKKEQFVPFVQAVADALHPWPQSTEEDDTVPGPPPPAVPRLFIIIQSNFSKRRSVWSSNSEEPGCISTQVALAVSSVTSVPIGCVRGSSSDQETSAFLLSIADYYHKGSHLKKRTCFSIKTKNKPDGDLRKTYYHMLCEIPTISDRRASIVVGQFPTLGSLLHALRTDDQDALCRLERAVEFGGGATSANAGRGLGRALVATLKDALLVIEFDDSVEF